MTQQTSIDTYNSIVSSGALSSLRMDCYDVLYEHGPATAKELVYAEQEKNPDHNYLDNIDKRLSELRDMGIAFEVGKRKCSVTGRNAIVWGVTGNLPIKLSKKDKLQSQIKKLENRISKLRARLDRE